MFSGFGFIGGGILELMTAAGAPSWKWLHVLFGIIIRATNARLVPTNDLALKKNTSDQAFDRFQVARLDIGTPVAVMHASVDRNWFFIESYSVSGWVNSKDLAVAEKAKVQYFEVVRPLVVTGVSVPFLL